MYRIKKDSNGFFYVICKASNGKTLWRSEPFKTKQSLWVFLRAFARTIESPSELTHIDIFDLSLKGVIKEYNLNVLYEKETVVVEYREMTKCSPDIIPVNSEHLYKTHETLSDMKIK